MLDDFIKAFHKDGNNGRGELLLVFRVGNMDAINVEVHPGHPLYSHHVTKSQIMALTEMTEDAAEELFQSVDAMLRKK